MLARSYFFSITFCVFLLLGPSTLYLDSLFDFKKFFGTLLAFPHCEYGDFWTLMRVSFLNILQGRVFVKWRGWVLLDVTGFGSGPFSGIFSVGTGSPLCWLHFFVLSVLILIWINDWECNHNVKQLWENQLHFGTCFGRGCYHLTEQGLANMFPGGPIPQYITYIRWYWWCEITVCSENIFG